MLLCALSIFTHWSMKFAAVNRYNVKDVVSFRRVVWAINNVMLYGD